ncbi:MAG: hypothetical protein AB7D57_13640 [Desulfovibrionaceae bacterium]
MGILFHPDPDHQVVYWFLHGRVTAAQVAAAQQQTLGLESFADWPAELIHVDPDTEFDPDIFSKYDRMRPLLRETLARMPARCAMVCSPIQMTSAPGFWISMAERPDLNRPAYTPFNEPAEAAAWLGIPAPAVEQALASLRDQARRDDDR